MAHRGGSRKSWFNRPRRQWSGPAASVLPEEVDEDWAEPSLVEEDVASSSKKPESKTGDYEGASHEDVWEAEGDWEQSDGASGTWDRGWKWDSQWGWFKLWQDPDCELETNQTWPAPRVEDTTMADNGRWYGHWGSSRTSSTRDEEPYENRGRPTEKMSVPEFNGEGTETDLGQTAIVVSETGASLASSDENE